MPGKLTERQREARSRAAAALREARERDRSVPLSRYARAEHTTVRTIRRYKHGGPRCASPTTLRRRTRVP